MMFALLKKSQKIRIKSHISSPTTAVLLFYQFNSLDIGPRTLSHTLNTGIFGVFLKNHKKFKYCSIYSIIYYNVLKRKSFVMLFI